MNFTHQGSHHRPKSRPRQGTPTLESAPGGSVSCGSETQKLGELEFRDEQPGLTELVVTVKGQNQGKSLANNSPAVTVKSMWLTFNCPI